MTEFAPLAASTFEGLTWLEDGKRALDWNGPSSRPFTKLHDEDLDRSIIDHLESVVRRRPGRLAVADSSTSLTFAELWDSLSGLAEIITTRTKPGDLIAIVLPASPMFPLAMLACLAAGRPFVALDPRYPGDWLAQVLADARPALMIVGSDTVVQSNAPGVPTTSVLVLAHLPLPAREAWRPAELGLDEPACVLFTSGSTGRPKGIVNSQRNLLQRVAQSINAAHINTEDKFLTLASLCTIVGVRDVMTALIAGASIRLIDPHSVGAREIVEVIRSEAITILFAFPGLLRSVLASAERAGDGLRLIRVGGDTTLWSDIDLMRAWAPEAAIQLIYAATEAPIMQWFVDDAVRGDDARIPIGYPLPRNTLTIVDDQGRSTPAGEIGELIVASPYVTVGSWVDGRIQTDTIEHCADRSRRIFRSGDLVRQRSDGLLERIGRKDRQVKIRGVRVELDGVEAALRQHPLVRDVGVLARAREGDGTVVLVAYVCTRGAPPAGLIDELKLLMRSAPPSMCPGRFHLVEEVPRLPSSKLDVRALAALDETFALSEHVGAATANSDAFDGDVIANIVAQVWQNVLQTPVGGPNDDFFEAGGDSLKAITFMIELERGLGAELSVGLVNEAPRFAQLCAALRDRRTPRYVPLVQLKAGEGLPPVFFVHGVGGNVVEILPMARRMAYPGPVIGIQARGLAGEGPPHTSVAAMAADYLREIKARQPNGPYYLCGYSFGGLIAYEMARLLREAGDEVGLVGLFDTMMSPLRWPLRAWLCIASRRGVRMCARIGARIRGRPTPLGAEKRPRSDLLKSAAPTNVLKVAASALLASARYRPSYYAGELTLFSPSGREPGLPPLQSIWRRHARALIVVETGGDHATMLSAVNAESTAALLTRYLPAA